MDESQSQVSDSAVLSDEEIRARRLMKPCIEEYNLENLPIEIIGSVLGFCEIEDYFNLISTSKKWFYSLKESAYVKTLKYTPKLFEDPQLLRHKDLIIKSVKGLNVLDRILNDNDASYIACMYNLKYLNLQGSRVKKLMDIIHELPHLKSLNLSMCSIHASHIHNLPSLSKTLKYLNLSDNDDIGLEEMKIVSKLENLITLKLNNCTDLDHEAIKVISNMKSLKHLFLANCVGLCDEAFKHIGKMTQLRVLKCRGCKLTEKGLYYIKDLKNLIFLDVKGSNLNWTKDSLKIIRSYSALEKLYSNGMFTDYQIKYISQLKRLINLKFDGYMSDETVDMIASMKRLKKLEISDCLSLTGEKINKFFDLVGMEQFKLEGCALLEAGSLSKMSNFKNLTRVSINGSPYIDDRDAIALSDLKLLTYISMQDTGITDAGISQWYKLTNLKTLLLGNQPISYGPKSLVTCNGLRHLTTLTNLSKLKIGNFERMEDHNWDFIQAFSNLTSVEITCCGLREDDIVYFEPLNQLQKLDISLNEEMNPICFKNMINKESLKYIYVGNRELWTPKDLRILLGNNNEEDESSEEDMNEENSSSEEEDDDDNEEEENGGDWLD